MMTAENDADREAFEAWFEYTSGFTTEDEAIARCAWQAALAHARQPGDTDGRVGRDIAPAFSRRLRANADHAERSKFSVCNLSTLKIEEARALAGFLEGALAPPAPVAVSDELKLEWRKGAPAKPWSKEWFIAQTTYGDRVVLRELPEEYTYDFKTADDTYIMRDKIAKWMQFPDSEYIAPTAPVPPAGGDVRVLREALEKALPIIQEQRDVLFECHSIAGRFVSKDEADDAAANTIAEMDACLASARAALATPPAEPDDHPEHVLDMVAPHPLLGRR